MNRIYIAFFVVSIVIVLFIVKWVLNSRYYLHYINQYPDDAYDFFVSHTDMWVVYDVASTDLIKNHLPSTVGLPQGKLLGPFQFRVPKHYNRIVTVYGKSKDCLESLEQFIFKMQLEAG